MNPFHLADRVHAHTEPLARFIGFDTGYSLSDHMEWILTVRAERVLTLHMLVGSGTHSGSLMVYRPTGVIWHYKFVRRLTAEEVEGIVACALRRLEESS